MKPKYTSFIILYIYVAYIYQELSHNPGEIVNITKLNYNELNYIYNYILCTFHLYCLLSCI